jgi:hypothetical protein
MSSVTFEVQVAPSAMWPHNKKTIAGNSNSAADRRVLVDILIMAHLRLNLEIPP